MEERKLIESWFPVDVISRDSAIEMSFKPQPAYIARCREVGLQCGRDFFDPKIRSLHPWLARRSRSVARALNLASILPYNYKDKFLVMLGFTRENLIEAVDKGYPPLLSYITPESGLHKDKVIMDPMAGGGSIPLESVMIGASTIACDYNPLSFLILRATIEFPAKYGIELWKRLTEEVKSLAEHVKSVLSPYYTEDAEGYIMLRQVRVGDKVIPLQSQVKLKRNSCVILENNSLSVGECSDKEAKREFLPKWMDQHVEFMSGKGEFEFTHRYFAIQTEKGFRLPEEKDQELLEKAYKKYLEGDSIIPKIPLPQDNEVFSDIIKLKRYDMLFNPRQAIGINVMMKYVRNRVRELVESEGEFGAALGLYLAFGVDRVIDFNTIATTWNDNTSTIRDTSGSYYKFRKIRIEGVYAEAIIPYRTLDWVFEPNAKKQLLAEFAQ